MHRLIVALILGAVACAEREPPFIADMTYEPVVSVGGGDEANELFHYIKPQIWLVDSASVAYSDEGVPGRLVVADLITGQGWSRRDPRGSDGPGELGGITPWVSSASDTVKALTPNGRLSARLLDGTLAYDSLIGFLAPTIGVSMAGLARNNRVSVYVEQRVGGVVGINLESPSSWAAVPIYTIETRDQIFNYGVIAAARDDLIAYLYEGTVTTLDGLGRPLATRDLPWKTFSLSIDGSGRVWVQVFGHDPDGYNLVVLDRNLKWIGQAVIPRFRDAYGDYVISLERDETDADQVILSRLVR